MTQEETLRVDLAAAFRLAVRFGWHESVANHFSAAVSDDGKKFLLNPRWRHFSLIKASDLLLLDADDPATLERPDAPDPSAWCIHGSIHAALPEAKVLLHLHPPYATALAGLADPTILPIDQNTARFYDRVAYDLNFGGLGDVVEEGQRIAQVMQGKPVMMMGNHGVMVAAASVAYAFEEMYYLEIACRTMVLALSTGQPLSIISDKIARKTLLGWEKFLPVGQYHFAQLKELLDRDDPSYRD
jgi:ribulose-5-phosphate 4-epimerase/fuculose-1-phosphate aldolase